MGLRGRNFDVRASAGTHFWAGVVKQLGPPDSSGYIQITGRVGTLRFSK